jgi:phage I-like protein
MCNEPFVFFVVLLLTAKDAKLKGTVTYAKIYEYNKHHGLWTPQLWTPEVLMQVEEEEENEVC